MAAVNSVVFDKAAYTPGDLITVTVDYTPDTPSVVPQSFTFTTNVTDAGGNVVATNTSPFTVNSTQQGDKVAVSDDGSHSWAEGATTPEADGSLSVAFTSTA